MDYLLKHKEITVASLRLDDSAAIVKIKDLPAPEHLPVGIPFQGGLVDRAALNEWWLGRSIPAYRQGLQSALEELQITSPQHLLEKNFGLSLSDQYWICPQSASISWSDINFFTNEFAEDAGEILLGKHSNAETINLISPDNTSDGWLRKRWAIIRGVRCLIKGGSGATWQEPYNEVLASAIMRRLGIPHVPYTLMMRDEYPYSVCETFITQETELVRAWHVMRTRKKRNDLSLYQHYLDCCYALGLDGVRQAVDQMLALDYLIVNEDRHQNNFGLIRNADSLEWLGAAPVFDSGSSLWFTTPTPMIHPAASRAACKPFKSSHEEQIKLVSSFDWLDLSALDGIEDEFYEIVRESAFMDEARSQRIAKALRGRIQMLDSIKHTARKSVALPSLEHEVAQDISYAGEDTFS